MARVRELLIASSILLLCLPLAVLLTLMLHAADGVIQIERLGFVGADADRTVWLYSGLWCLMALSVLVLDWNTWRARQPMAPREVLSAEALLKP